MADKGKYRTYRGRYVDLDSIRTQHDNNIAMGNMGVNARGDRIGPGGRIVEKASVKARQHYAGTSISTKNAVSIKSDQSSDMMLFDAETKAPVNPTVTPTTPAKGKKLVEVENDKGDIVLQEVDDENKGTTGKSSS